MSKSGKSAGTRTSRRTFIKGVASLATAGVPLSRRAVAKDVPTLKIGVASLGFERMDPFMEIQVPTQDRNLLMFDSIFEPGPNNEIAPGVAESWSVDSTGHVWTFKVRRGIQFHGGYGELTAEDVVFTLDRWRAPGIANADNKLVTTAVESATVIDPYTFQVRTHGPRPTLPLALFPQESAGGIVLCKKYLMQAGPSFEAQSALMDKRPIGSGPYEFVGQERGRSLTLQAVKDHWRVKPDIKRIEFVVVPEIATQMFMMQSGELDLIVVDPDSASQLKTEKKISVQEITNALDFGILIWSTWTENGKGVPTADPRVRRAISKAIDRKTIVDKLMLGFGVLPKAPWGISPDAFGLDLEPLKGYLADVNTYDPDGARALLKEAGYPNGFKIRMMNFLTGTVFDQIDLAMTAQLAKVGIQAEIKVMEYPTLRPYLTTNQNDPFIAGQLVPWRATPVLDPQVPLLNFCSQQGTAKLLNDSRFDALVAEIGQTLDVTKRIELTRQALDILIKSWIQIPVVSTSVLYAYNNTVVSKWPARQGTYFLSRQIELMKAVS